MHWREITEMLEEMVNYPRFGLITDVDGTLSPIVSDPDAATVTPRSKELLADLVEVLPLVAVVSGRAADDVHQRVGVDGMVYVGNHGLEEWKDGGVDVVPEVEQYRPALAEVRDKVQARAVDGMLVEDKGATLSIHYRNVDVPAQVAEDFRPFMEEITEEAGLELFPGRMIFEVRPPLEINKGEAFRRLVEEYSLNAAIYIGDDTTDVDALKVAREMRSAAECFGVGIGVEGDETPESVVAHSDALTSGVSDVEELLDWLLSAARASST